VRQEESVESSSIGLRLLSVVSAGRTQCRDRCVFIDVYCGPYGILVDSALSFLRELVVCGNLLHSLGWDEEAAEHRIGHTKQSSVLLLPPPAHLNGSHRQAIT